MSERICSLPYPPRLQFPVQSHWWIWTPRSKSAMWNSLSGFGNLSPFNALIWHHVYVQEVSSKSLWFLFYFFPGPNPLWHLISAVKLCQKQVKNIHGKQMTTLWYKYDNVVVSHTLVPYYWNTFWIIQTLNFEFNNMFGYQSFSNSKGSHNCLPEYCLMESNWCSGESSSLLPVWPESIIIIFI